MIPIRDVNPTKTVPVITLAIIAINVLIFALWQPHDATVDSFIVEQGAIPCEVTGGEPISSADLDAGTCVVDDQTPFFPSKGISLSVLVSIFLHGDFMHIGFNMWSLWIFGDNVEEAFGRSRYLAMYLISGLAATLGYIALNANSIVPLVGASGAIAGAIGSYLVLYPRHRINAYVPPLFIFPIPARWFIGIWFVGQFFIGAGSGVAWQAHVAGFLVGALITFLMRRSLEARLVEFHGSVPQPR